jgi:Skp family chaperone for outer membrane proteins
MMQKISLAISILAIVLCGVLFFTRGNNDNASREGIGSLSNTATFMNADSTGSSPRIAFVKGDSINQSYQFIIDKQQELISSSKISEGRLKSRLTGAEKEYQELVQYAQSGQASEEEMQIAQNRIMELQYELQQAESAEQNRLMQQEQVIQVQIVERLDAFLKKFAAENSIDIILNWGISGEGILYGSQPFDITSAVIDGLNTEYAIEKMGNEEAK